MKQEDLINSIDKKYLFLVNLTNKNTAKELFKSYLLRNNINGDTNEIKVKIAFKDFSIYDMISQIARHALIYSCMDVGAPANEVFVEFKNKLLENHIEYDQVVDYLIDNKDDLEKLIDSFVEQRYYCTQPYRICYDISNPEIQKYLNHLVQMGKSNYKPSIIGKISNLLFNRCRQDLFDNKQFCINHKSYSLGKNLYACIDRGNEYNSQNGSVIISNHPDLKDFKIIAVADGDASKEHGGNSSSYVLKSLLEWFENLDYNYFDNIQKLKPILENALKTINYELNTFENKTATSVAIAIIGNYNSLISTIGNTRVYLVKNNKVSYETKDDSYVESLCDKGLADPKTKRFHKAFNFNIHELGTIKDNKIYSKNTKVVDNNYEKILILSNGVTRLLDNNKIEKILLNTKENQVVDRLVEVANSEDSHMDKVDIWCDSIIKAGENNATVAMYVKRR